MKSSEKKYTVKALSVGGIGNKVFKSGDVVTEKNFPEGNAEELVKKGFLIAAKENASENEISLESEIKKVRTTDSVETSKKSDADSSSEFKGKKFINSKNVESVAMTIDDITVKELIKELTEAKADFDSQSKKTVLFELWIGL